MLVSGGASFIGSHLTEALVELGAEVTVVDDLSSGKLEDLSAVMSAIRFIEGDLRRDAVAKKASARQEIVFHLAAAHGGRGYIESHPVECMNNMVLDHAVFSAAAAAGAEKIVTASSACAYPTTLQASEDERLLLREDDANFDEPGRAFADGEYGWAKLMSELQLRAFHRQYGISGICCRLFTAYGERENETHAVIALIAKAVARLDPYPVWGSGLQTRNFTYVGDTVTGMMLAGAHLDGFEVINVGSDTHHTILELAREIFRFLHWSPSEIKPELDRPVGVRSRAADLEKCRRLLGWAPQTSLRDGVSRTVAWYIDAHGEPDTRRLEQLLMER
jgi:UDP-glucose 4-epimerase